MSTCMYQNGKRIANRFRTYPHNDKDISQEKYKWCAKDISKFSQLNPNSLSKWITITKKVIRSACRKMRKDKHHNLPNSIQSILIQRKSAIVKNKPLNHFPS